MCSCATSNRETTTRKRANTGLLHILSMVLILLLVSSHHNTPFAEAKLRYLGLQLATQTDIIQDWTAQSGVEVDVDLVDVPKIVPWAEADKRAEINDFDVYSVHQSMFKFAEKNWVRNINQDITSEQFKWGDIALATRQQTEFDNGVWSVPVDSDSYLMYYRRDLIDTPPTNWEEYIEVSAKFHGKDLNGDGTPDFGACTITDGQFSNLAYTVAATVMKHKSGNRQGFIFDISDNDDELMRNLLDTKGWRYTMEIVKRIWNVSQGFDVNVATVFDQFRSGRCATYISYPSAGSQTVADEAYISTKLGVARAPGSTKVYNRKTDEMELCTKDLCPNMVPGESTNRPSFITGGVMLMINSVLEGEDLKNALNFAAYYSTHVDVRRAGGINPFRKKHFNATWFTEAAVPWDLEDAKRYTTALSGVFESSHSVTSPQISNVQTIFDSVERAMKEYVNLFPHNRSASDPAPSLDVIMANAIQRIDEESLADGYTKESLEQQLRKSLSLPPYIPPTEEDHTVLIMSTALGVVGALIILLVVVLTYVMLRKPPGVGYAPLNQDDPFVTVAIQTSASPKLLAQAAEACDVYMLRARMGAATVCVAQEITQGVAFLNHVCKSLADNGDGSKAATIKASIAFGHGSIVAPTRRNDEPAYSGRVIDTAVELFDISSAIEQPCVIMTVAEVVEMLTHHANVPDDPFSGAHREPFDDSQSSPHHPSHFPGVNIDTMFRVVGDRRFRGGIINRLSSVELPPLVEHPAVDDVHCASRRVLSVAGEDSGTMPTYDLSVSQDAHQSKMVGGAQRTKMVERRGSVVTIDCTYAQTAADVYQLTEVFTNTAQHFGGEVESITGTNAIATFGVHRANVLHEQNAVHAAQMLQEHLHTTVCLTTGPMTSCTLVTTKDGQEKRVQTAIGDAISSAHAMANSCATHGGVSRVFAQQEIVHATGVLSLPYDLLSVWSSRTNEELTRISVHEIFTKDKYPYSDKYSDEAVLFRDVFDKLRHGEYALARGRLSSFSEQSDYDRHFTRLVKMTDSLITTFGETHGKGYRHRVSCMFPPSKQTLVGASASGSRTGNISVTANGSSVQLSQSRVPDGNQSTSSNLFGVSTNSLNGTAKETTTDKIRRKRQEVAGKLRNRTNMTAVDDGLISMFVADETVDTEDANLELPSTLQDVTNVSWTRSVTPSSAGAFATVYRAISHTGRVVSLKCFDMESNSSGTTFDAEEIANEVSTLSSYTHENIIGYITYGFVDRYCFIVMEHASGGSLYSALKEYGTLSVGAVRNYIRDALQGLEYLHLERVYHCDIKPHNILIGSDGICKIGDFGSTMAVGFAESTTEQKVLARGTPAYMSPEACRGEETSAGDIWGIGITLIELLTGELPWPKGLLRDINRFIAEFGSADSTIAPTIPTSLDTATTELVNACLQRDPTKRPSATQALQFAFFH